MVAKEIEGIQGCKSGSSQATKKLNKGTRKVRQNAKKREKRNLVSGEKREKAQ